MIAKILLFIYSHEVQDKQVCVYVRKLQSNSQPQVYMSLSCCRTKLALFCLSVAFHFVALFSCLVEQVEIVVCEVVWSCFNTVFSLY